MVATLVLDAMVLVIVIPCSLTPGFTVKQRRLVRFISRDNLDSKANAIKVSESQRNLVTI